MATDETGERLFARHPGCNRWLSSGNGWGSRCGDLPCNLAIRLCASCAAQIPPEQPGERDALIAEWVSMLDPEGWPTPQERERVAANLRADLPPIAGLRALVTSHHRDPR